ncbi:MAG: AAA family ATPase, partial [Oligoflexus sp.]
AAQLQLVIQTVSRRVVGHRLVLERLLMGLIGQGHVLLEGLPGLAKTTAVRALSDCSDLTISRIQFTPDLLPADVVGTQIYDPRQAEFKIKKGPVFTHLLIADEINRAPAKVQSALLEAMQERQVTLGDQTYTLPKPFLVMATQNPIEQEGT